MTEKQKLLFMAWAYADHLDKSTEWMFQYMSDFAKVDYDEAVNHMINSTQEKREAWYHENPNWLEEHDLINQKRYEQGN